jgi:ATP-dependent DNA helicase DinG
MTARQLLGPDGPLARGIENYEDRAGQLEMADAVERAIADEHALLCEAGTGTGKTLAYLVPAILSGRKVVVSTATKALEEQIFHKDLPLVTRHLGLDPQAALVKGLGNYLCLRRYHELRTSSAALTDPALGRSLPMIEAWASDTETGDVSELSGLAESDPIWREICSSSETRIGSTCEYFERCFVTRMKRDMERARLLVVNHHLFFADLALRSSSKGPGPRVGALPPYDVVIFDEAHQLEDIATSFFGTRISRARIESMLRDAERAFVAAGLAFPTAGKGGKRARHDKTLALSPNTTGEGSALLALVSEASEHLFSCVTPLAHGAHLGAEGKVALAPALWTGALLDAYHRLDTALDALRGYADLKAVTEPLRLVATRAEQLREDAARIVDPAINRIAWLEVRARSIALGASPIDLGATFREQVFERIGAVVLTSATLTTGGAKDFRFLRSRLGIQDREASGVVELAVASPFDHAAASLLYTPSDLPDARDSAFGPAAADRVADLVAIAGGGVFVLCTSLRAMHAFAHTLEGRTPEPLLLQGVAPKGALLAQFRASGNAVLVATMSFWEGVDVPGDALRLVVIDKIPFAVPTDPIVVARSAALEAAGKNPFIAYAVPQAAIALKQGFGRLLRSRIDRGVVAILDRRVLTRGYGTTLLGSLPPARRTERLDEVRAFFSAR